ncbi:CGNR zinc finger domain-containing protein [Streptomyces sp. NPDC088197]|uniref:CGNR zinc finger domain-containing protein n=1 Tax=unclassified Streptomyces TaxID=2593676 RepID=UPI0033AC717E
MSGTSPLRFDTGRLCLDLVATRTGRPERERLGTPDRLAAWLYGTGLVPRAPGEAARPDLAVDDGWLSGFRGLRAVVCRVVTAEVAGERPAAADIAELNATALAAPPAPRAVTGEGGALIRTLAAPPEPAGLLAAVARDAVALLTDPLARTQLRRCEGENCSLVYLDTSRGRRRRWCSSEICGNRERVARHRRRTTTRGTLTSPQG